MEKIAHVLQTPVPAFFAAAEVEEAAVQRIMHRLSTLGPDELDWIDQVIAAALQRPQER